MAGMTMPQDSAPAAPAPEFKGLPLTELRTKFAEFFDKKRPEINERKEARRYYHAAQWTEGERKKLESRKQPVVTYNRVQRKIDGIVGLLERLRQDPKAFARTPAHDEGAELATQCLRFVLDDNDWQTLSSEAARDMSIDGIGGFELSLEPDGSGSFDAHLEQLDPSTFFYDPRSIKPDFNDARYMGVHKWMDLDAAVDMFPDHEEHIRDSVTQFTDEGDSDTAETGNLWWDSRLKKVRIVEIWYKRRGTWAYAFYTGKGILTEGETPFKDDKGQAFCRFIAQSANVDHDGDRYGFFRNLKSVQDEINHRRSKSLHLLNSSKLIIEEGTVPNIEEVRAEWNKPDGVIVLPPGAKVQESDDSKKVEGNLRMLEDAKAEIENFGPNPALVGTGMDNQSGRAIALLQQAAIAELGPFILRFRALKLRTYRAVWDAVRTYWKTEKYIRITDDDNTGFLVVNTPVTDEWGQVVGMENPIGKVNVDIVLDESGDTVTMRQDAADQVVAAAQAGIQIPPDVMMEVIELPPEVRAKIKSAMEQGPNPQEQAMVQMQMEEAQAKTRKTLADAGKSEADAILKLQQAQIAPLELMQQATEAQGAPQGQPMMQPEPMMPEPQQYMPGVI